MLLAWYCLALVVYLAIAWKEYRDAGLNYAGVGRFVAFVFVLILVTLVL